MGTQVQENELLSGSFPIKAESTNHRERIMLSRLQSQNHQHRIILIPRIKNKGPVAAQSSLENSRFQRAEPIWAQLAFTVTFFKVTDVNCCLVSKQKITVYKILTTLPGPLHFLPSTCFRTGGATSRQILRGFIIIVKCVSRESRVQSLTTVRKSKGDHVC